MGKNTEFELANAVVTALFDKNKKVATAESCTGGMLAAAITKISGSSNVFEYGIIAYANRIKEAELGVKGQSLSEFGAVSEFVACEMAEGVKEKAKADFGIAITGIAGPLGGTPLKPVGTVYIALAAKGKTIHQKLTLGEKCQSTSDDESNRDCIRRESVISALRLLARELDCAE